MADPDEVVREYSSITEAECSLFEEYEDALLEAGATHVYVQRREDHPNRAELWGPTVDAVEAAVERYSELHERELER